MKASYEELVDWVLDAQRRLQDQASVINEFQRIGRASNIPELKSAACSYDGSTGVSTTKQLIMKQVGTETQFVWDQRGNEEAKT